MYTCTIHTSVQECHLCLDKSRRLVWFIVSTMVDLSVEGPIRYLSFHDNKFLRYFKGHTQRYAFLPLWSSLYWLFIQILQSMFPGNESTRWYIHIGIIWQVGSVVGSKERECDWSVEYYGCRTALCCVRSLWTRLWCCPRLFNYSIIRRQGIYKGELSWFLFLEYSNMKGPFATFDIDRTRGSDLLWHHIEFSNDGKHILISTLGPYLYIIDAFDGSTVHVLEGHENDGDLPLKASFTPDGKYVLCGMFQSYFDYDLTP